ncbi:unnamed protein product [Durusdinium trenchii]|uniref:J domain-containing protein n=1 Tax=Durusdinium trenchii TaxID=1381693 RepID=A0ABP0K400_9DINO
MDLDSDAEEDARPNACGDQPVEWTAEDDDAWEAETERDYYAALELTRGSHISTSRVRAAYHKLARKWHPYLGCPDEADGESKIDNHAVLRRFWAISEAYLVLTDSERRRIYDECGFQSLKQSESCYAESVFEKDAFQIYEDFFNGSDPEARDFLLMNGGMAGSSSESEESWEADVALPMPDKPGAVGRYSLVRAVLLHLYLSTGAYSY